MVRLHFADACQHGPRESRTLLCFMNEQPQEQLWDVLECLIGWFRDCDGSGGRPSSASRDDDERDQTERAYDQGEEQCRSTKHNRLHRSISRCSTSSKGRS